MIINLTDIRAKSAIFGAKFSSIVRTTEGTTTTIEAAAIITKAITFSSESTAISTEATTIITAIAPT